jgi:hypothetical protein
LLKNDSKEERRKGHEKSFLFIINGKKERWMLRKKNCCYRSICYERKGCPSIMFQRGVKMAGKNV